MLWLKRNLTLVIGGAVAVALMGFAGYYVFSKYQAERQAEEQLNQKVSELKRLLNRDPHPGTEELDNISQAEEDLERIKGFREDFTQYFASFDYPTVESSQQFRNLLVSTIFELQENARKSGVDVPTNYNFTFTAQRTVPSFDPASLRPLVEQVTEVKAICNVLFDAKVHRLLGLRRAQIAPSDQRGRGSPTDYLTQTIKTNDLTLVAPYEVSFEGFTSELGHIMNTLADSPQCFLVKFVKVQKASASSSDFMSGYGGGSMMERYGIQENRDPYGGSRGSQYGGRYGGRSQYGDPYGRSGYGQSRQQNVPRSGLITLIDEETLRFTLRLGLVKLKPEPQPASERAPGPGSPAAAQSAQSQQLPARYR